MKYLNFCLILSLCSWAFAEPRPTPAPDENIYECSFITKSSQIGLLYIFAKKGTSINMVDRLSSQMCETHLNDKCLTRCHQIDELPPMEDFEKKYRHSDNPQKTKPHKSREKTNSDIFV